jgi:hypothetical protein
MDGRQEAPIVSVRKDVLEPAARLCAAARVLVRHGRTLKADESDRLLAEIDDAAGNLQDGVSTLVRSATDGASSAAHVA